jgi:hypothetical protein
MAARCPATVGVSRLAGHERQAFETVNGSRVRIV